jgi:hypothetical protein
LVNNFLFQNQPMVYHSLKNWRISLSLTIICTPKKILQLNDQGCKTSFHSIKQLFDVQHFFLFSDFFAIYKYLENAIWFVCSILKRWIILETLWSKFRQQLVEFILIFKDYESDFWGTYFKNSTVFIAETLY